MTSLYAIPRKARVISDGRIVNIHGYSQEQLIEGGGAEVVAIVEYESGCMGTQLVSLLELCAPTAPQLAVFTEQPKQDTTWDKYAEMREQELKEPESTLFEDLITAQTEKDVPF